MNDFKFLLRSAYYSLLNGTVLMPHVQTNGTITNGPDTVIVGGTLDPMTDPGNAYILLVSQQGSSNNTHQSFMSEERITVDMIARGSTRVSAAILDNMANQILNIILPTPQNNALANSKIINCRVIDDRYQPFRSEGGINIARRMITFLQTVAQ